MTAVAIQAPINHAGAIDLSRTLYRKQVLKKGVVNYKGRRLVFDDAYLADLAASFRAGAYDQVPFVLATADNAHNMLPERCRGEIKAFVPTDDGLDALVELSEDAANIIAENPKLGVSCRIVEQLEQADGRKFPRAVQHVLGTLDPRITGMRPWEAVELSTPGQPVVDLTEATYEEAPVPELTEDEVARLRALLATAPDPVTPPAPAVQADDGPSDADIEAALAALLADSTPEPAAAGAELSAETRAALEFAQANDDQRRIELAAITAELDDERYRREAADLAAAGVPPHRIELAKPLLLGKNHVVDLANGSKVDAGAVIRAVLEDCKGEIDLSGEHGAAFPSASVPSDESAAANDLVAKFKEQYGFGGAK